MFQILVFKPNILLLLLLFIPLTPFQNETESLQYNDRAKASAFINFVVSLTLSKSTLKSQSACLHITLCDTPRGFNRLFPHNIRALRSAM